MKECVTAALPFVLMGLALAVWAANSVGKKEKKQNNRLGQGMIIGLMFGVAVGTTGVMDYAVCISLGMLWGIALSTLFEDKK